MISLQRHRKLHATIHFTLRKSHHPRYIQPKVTEDAEQRLTRYYVPRSQVTNRQTPEILETFISPRLSTFMSRAEHVLRIDFPCMRGVPACGAGAAQFPEFGAQSKWAWVG